MLALLVGGIVKLVKSGSSKAYGAKTSGKIRDDSEEEQDEEAHHRQAVPREPAQGIAPLAPRLQLEPVS